MVQFTRIRLSGFKSFVEPTEFEIGPGLTGIVGPNGCGKSNLVEALRWVMGENSPKRMRSTGMDDVIFSGTEHRPGRNTAEVVLSLDNTDRTAPAEINDSDDLEVSRRIEREVGSVYKVNGKSVRMRDVQLLFADSSIGAHSPAMVSQGRVADMINAKPAQRRMVLEEAAGISGLHARRHEAELKLRAAEQNLVRVEDVAGAMNAQLEGLKKQARQASRYRNISGHISTTEGGVLYLRWMQSTTAVQAALDAFQTADNIVRDKTLLAAELATQQTEAAADLPQMRLSEAEAAAALQRLKLAYGSLESEERHVRDERAKSESLLQQFNADVAHENAQRQEAAGQTEFLKSEQADLAAAAGNQTGREDEARILKEERQVAVEKLETELGVLTEEVAGREAGRNAAERAIADLDRRLTNLRSRKEAHESEHAAIIARTPARAALDEIAERVAALDETYQEAIANADLAEGDRVPAESLVNEKTESLQAIQRSFSQLTAEAEALRRILKNRQEGYQPVIDSLNVETGLEKALAVALGDDLQAALDGAAPIYWRELPEFSTALPLPSEAKPLSQAVQGPRALGRVLSQIGIVDTAETAVRLMADLQPGQCLVTLDGGAWRWDGLVVSANAENPSAIRLQQKNRLAELEAEIETTQSLLEDSKIAVALAKEWRAEVLDAVNTARQAFKGAEEILNGLRKRHTALSHELTEVTAKLSGLAASIENAGTEAQATASQLDEAREAFVGLPDASEGRARIAAIRLELGTAREALASTQAIHAEIRREGEARTRRLQQVSSDLEGWINRIERVDLRLIELQERIAQATDVLTRLASRPAEIEGEKQNLMSRISDAEKRRQEAADILISTEGTAGELQRTLKAAENALSDAREARALAQGQVNTAQQAQGSVEVTINEKFTCTPEELVSKLELKIEELPDIGDLQEKLDRLLRERDNMGPVNLRAEVEAQEISDKMTTMTAERDDLTAAIGKLREGIGKLNKEARERLLSAFDVVNGHFQTLFTRLFNGGSAYLKLIEADDPLEAGLEIFAQPPGKKLQVLSLLSGGEQTLTSIALIFGMFLTNPAPICVLDEVDAPLDESNVDRYCTLLEDLVKECRTRFIVVTHHRMTMARMDRLYGVTMSERGVSQLVSVDLKQHELQLEQAA
jgi:chromosome segregation protein